MAARCIAQEQSPVTSRKALFPSPLRGGVRGGGASWVFGEEPNGSDRRGGNRGDPPIPDPSPQGGREAQGSCARCGLVSQPATDGALAYPIFESVTAV